MAIPDRSFHGLALRIFDPDSGLWSIHWADNLRHRLLPPMVGRFEDGRGTFLGDEEHAGQPVLARFIWFPSVEAPRWEQAFSADGGETWETNWVVRFYLRDRHTTVSSGRVRQVTMCARLWDPPQGPARLPLSTRNPSSSALTPSPPFSMLLPVPANWRSTAPHIARLR